MHDSVLCSSTLCMLWYVRHKAGDSAWFIAFAGLVFCLVWFCLLVACSIWAKESCHPFSLHLITQNREEMFMPLGISFYTQKYAVGRYPLKTIFLNKTFKYWLAVALYLSDMRCSNKAASVFEQKIKLCPLGDAMSDPVSD